MAGSRFTFPADGVAALNAPLGLVVAVTADLQGNIYVADSNNDRIFRINPQGGLSTFAGDGVYGWAGDGGAAASGSIANPRGLVADISGNVYISDAGNFRIRKVTAVGVISTLAGSGRQGYAGDGGSAVQASFGTSTRIAKCGAADRECRADPELGEFRGGDAGGAGWADFGIRIESDEPGGAAGDVAAAADDARGTQVLIGGVPMPLLYAGPGQINAVAPFDVAVGTAQVIVQSGITLSVPEPATVASAGPGAFTQNGIGAGLAFVGVANPDGSGYLAGPSAPAHPGSAIVIYCTGLGGVQVSMDAGNAAPLSPLSPANETVEITLGEVQAQVLFAGLAPTFSGLYQINARDWGQCAAGDHGERNAERDGGAADPLAGMADSVSNPPPLRPAPEFPAGAPVPASC